MSKAPFTAILLITEMVGSLNHLMPLALTALSAYVVVDFLGGAPTYTSLLENMQLKRTLTTFSDNNHLFSLPIFNDSLIANQQVKNIKWTAQTLLINIQRGEHQLVPNGDTIIQVGDTLQVSTNQAGYQQLQQYL
ncbi:TrkA C-terminal domain-containing protein [Bombilactobacillus bombi]|uniref:TrkA C-terminal domain-containing protein n=1 Tax=Bombilactobacillus bombi TaxID=1303590 RepID=UPI002175099C|nr:TrkA C-terminal domain-containing protein [Bombilactobacillus bombi]